MTKRVIHGLIEHVVVNHDAASRALFWTALVRGDDLTAWGCATKEITDDYHSRPTLLGTYPDYVNAKG